MNHYLRLLQVLSQTPLLMIDAEHGTARLLTHKAGRRFLRKSSQTLAAVALVDAKAALTGFARIVGTEDRIFGLREISQVMAVPYARINLWEKDGVITPSLRSSDGQPGRERLFTYTDTYVAGLCASLRRQGVPLKILKRISALFSNPQSQPSMEGQANEAADSPQKHQPV